MICTLKQLQIVKKYKQVEKNDYFSPPVLFLYEEFREWLIGVRESLIRVSVSLIELN